MRHALGWVSSALLGLCAVMACESRARAQESYFRTPVPAPKNAFEFQLSGGYTQGFGNVFPNHGIIDVAGAGFGLTATIGYRMSSVVSWDLEGQYQAFSSENFGTAQGLDVNVGATLHARPSHRGDPWLRLATGYRFLFISETIPGPGGFGTLNGNVDFHGWDVINARIGYDIRSSANLAWAPIVGANLQTFIWANSTLLSTVQWGTFIYAGLQARFDVGGPREAYVGSASSSRGDD
jgi:hypothetical protein